MKVVNLVLAVAWIACPVAVRGGILRDDCWMWGHDAGHLDGPGNMWKLPVEGKVEMVEACKYMGLENLNVIRWGNPPKAYREQFRGMKRITWPICGHQDERNASFEEMCEYDFRLIDELPNLVGFEMDDFFRDKEPLITVQTDRGPRLSYRSAFSYEKLVALRRRLKSCSRAIDLRLVVYDELLSGDHPEAVVPCAELADVLTYWTWKADDIVDFEKRFAQLRSLVPGKPVFIGIYLWDFGGKLAPMPVRLLKIQLESGLSLWKRGEAAGFVFLATSICKKNLDAVEYVRAWIAEHGEERRK